MATQPRRAHDPAFTPVPAILQALADVREVDLESGLGPRRLAEVTRQAAAPRPERRRRWPATLGLLAAAIGALLLAL